MVPSASSLLFVLPGATVALSLVVRIIFKDYIFESQIVKIL